MQLQQAQQNTPLAGTSITSSTLLEVSAGNYLVIV
jgi:hypothetical protein